MVNQPEKKRHHYVPVTYLSRFTDASGFLRVYRKDEPNLPLRLKPSGIGFRKYYYSQPTPDGGQNNNALEDSFSQLESGWGALADKIAQRGKLTPEDTVQLFGFAGLQRVRVPAARDMVESLLSQRVLHEAKTMHARGELPPLPEGYPDLLDKIVVSIDPHQSIHAMVDLMRALGPVFDAVGLELLHNETSVSFITSDNPVAIFDPSVPVKKLHPYVLERSLRTVELLFPIDPRTLLRGHTSLRTEFGRRGPRHRTVRDETLVRNANRLTARFGYEMIIASDDQHGALARVYSHESPVLSKTDGTEPAKMIFGRRSAKPKWTSPEKD